MRPPFLQNKSLKNFSTFGVGGAARYFTQVTTVEEMKEVLLFCKEGGLPFFILGRGSNTLFDDRGFNGLVIVNKIDFIEQKEHRFRVGAGFSFVRLGQITAKSHYTGLEFAAAIPGSVGGAIFMNAGAQGQETFDALEEVRFLTEYGEELFLPKSALTWGYRSSSFHNKRGAIVEATFLLTPSKSAKRIQKEHVDYRFKTQPYGEKSCGCIFQNPAGIAAGKLIEECGLKGASVEGAVVSELHANFIVNRGGATAKDVLALIQRVKDSVYEKKGILLQEEVRLIPYDE